MTDEAVRQAVSTAVRNAFRLGKECTSYGHNADQKLKDALRYAEGLIFPTVSARIDQAIEDADLGSRYIETERSWGRAKL